jgi:Superinfection immunity protein
MGDMGDSPARVIVPVLAALIYLLPTLIAYGRDIPQRQLITLVNVVFGWTLVGWIVASIWAMSAPPAEAHLLRERADDF